MSEDTTVPLHRAIVVLAAILAVSLVTHIHAIVWGKDTNIAQTAQGTEDY